MWTDDRVGLPIDRNPLYPTGPPPPSARRIAAPPWRRPPPAGQGGPIAAGVRPPLGKGARIDPERVRRVIRETAESADRLTRVLYATNAAYGYLPWPAAELIAAEFGKTMTDLYTTASLLANFRGAPEGQGTAIPRGGRKFTGNLGVAGVWPKASPPPAHDRLHEDEVHHVLEPAFAR